MRKSKATQSVLLKKKHYKQELRASCVPAAARMVLEYLGIAVENEAFLRRILKTKASGTNIPNLLYLQDEKFWQLDVHLLRGTMTELTSKLSKEKIPVIVVVETGPLPHWHESTAHVMLVVGYDQKNIIVNDPNFETDEIKVPIGRFQEAWSSFQNLMVTIKRLGVVN